MKTESVKSIERVSVSMTRPSSSSHSADEKGPTVWGLNASQLHDAWWRGRGVQCVHRDSDFEPSSGAELFLLLDPGQIVSFDLADIAEMIVWSSARAFWISVIERSDESYKEELIRTSADVVVGIRRSYAFEERLGHRCVITTNEDLAREWAGCHDKVASRKLIRDFAGVRSAHARVYGHSRDLHLVEDRRKFISWLVATWEDPSRVIGGIEAVRPGIYAPADTVLSDDAVCIDPVWLGFNDDLDSSRVLVGPDYTVDNADPGIDVSVGIRQISEIPAPDGRRGGRLLPRQSVYQTVKRLFDLLMSVAVLVVFSPLMLMVAVAVVVNDGFPIFFGHTRQKKDGQEFKCWKFRTMRRNAEAMVDELQAKNKADGPQVLIEDDPRVTRVGNILRKFQLDELPQFWNVMLGDMSIVGPRPSPDKENQFCPAWREMRLSVRPGITGLWQVERTRAPGQDFQEWIRYDIEYVRKASFGLDIRIIFKTAWNIIRR